MRRTIRTGGMVTREPTNPFTRTGIRPHSILAADDRVSGQAVDPGSIRESCINSLLKNQVESDDFTEYRTAIL